MGKAQRAQRRKRAQARDEAGGLVPLIDTSYRNRPSTLSKAEAFALPVMSRAALPAEDGEYRRYIKEPQSPLYGSRIGFKGTIKTMKLYAWLFAEGETDTRAFVSGHLLSKSEWDAVRLGDPIECLGRKQKGTTCLYAVEIIPEFAPAPAIQAAE